jgi:uncharacterized protein YndB with AHSA1/START domain
VADTTTTFTTPSDTEIAITRVFAAPRRLVFEAWTRPEHLPHWMGPADWTMTGCEIDLRPGGAFRFSWRHAGGDEMSITGAYREIVPPERLVTTERWSDDWPETTNTLVLTEEGGWTTTVCTIRYPSREAREAALRTPMREGMSAGYDRLEEYLNGLEA